MRDLTKEELKDRVGALTKGAATQVCLDSWTGCGVRREESLKLTCSHWAA